MNSEQRKLSVPSTIEIESAVVVSYGVMDIL